MRRVVITGIGPVCAGQTGKDSFFQSLLQKQTLIEAVPAVFEQNCTLRSRFFVPPPKLDGYEKSMEEVSKIALECSVLAIVDAGLENLAGAGVIIGVGMGSLNTGFTSYHSHVTGEGRFNRLVIPMLMPNAPAAWIAMKYGADKQSCSVNAACSSGTIAIGEAYQKIAGGLLDTVLAGGVDCLTDSHGAIMRGFDSLGALTLSKDGRPRPFSKKRSGFLFNMGAGCALILEEMEHAKARGARIYAEISGYDCNTSAGGIVQLPDDITGLLQLFEMAKGKRIDYFNTHGTGTEQNDRIEGEVIRRLWGDHQPFLNSTKGIIGHSIGASGALEAAVTALSIYHGQVHGNLTEDVMAGINCPEDSRELEIEHALSASYGFGGHNALLMMRKVPFTCV